MDLWTLQQQIEKYAKYFMADPNYGDQGYPFDDYLNPGYVFEPPYYLDKPENKDKSGKDFKEFEEFNEVSDEDKLKQREQPVLQPTPFFSGMFGANGLEGTLEAPLEYYSGSIINEPGAITNNPYNSIYQSANDRKARMKKRAKILKAII